MGRNWVIDVLADLRSFAEQNGMPVLAAQLREAICVAMIECASRTETVVPLHGDERADGKSAERLGHQRVSGPG